MRSLLLIDVINDFHSREADQVLKYARPMANKLSGLKQRAKKAGVVRLPVIVADLAPVTRLNWFVLVLGSLATFRLSHLMAKERGPFAVFERIRNAMPGGRGSVKEWVSCIWCFR